MHVASYHSLFARPLQILLMACCACIWHWDTYPNLISSNSMVWPLCRLKLLLLFSRCFACWYYVVALKRAICSRCHSCSKNSSLCCSCSACLCIDVGSYCFLLCFCHRSWAYLVIIVVFGSCCTCLWVFCCCSHLLFSIMLGCGYKCSLLIWRCVGLVFVALLVWCCCHLSDIGAFCFFIFHHLIVVVLAYALALAAGLSFPILTSFYSRG